MVSGGFLVLAADLQAWPADKQPNLLQNQQFNWPDWEAS